mgnify:CR=1 FL=1
MIQQDEPIFGNSGIKIILIDKKEYYLIYDHDNIPQLTQEKYENIIRNKEPDINLGTIILYDKTKTKDGKYVKITPIYKPRNKIEDNIDDMDVDMELDENQKNDLANVQKEGILMTDSINLNLLESDFNLLYKVMMILEGKNSLNLLEKTPFYYNFPYLNEKNNATRAGHKSEGTKKSNDVLKIDFNEKKLKIISIVNKGINMILFTIDINIEHIPDLNELLDISMKQFKNKARLVRSIDKSFNSNLRAIDELNLKKTTLTRINKEKNEKLMNFIVNELNKKKKNNYNLSEKINSLFTAPTDDKKNGDIEEDQKEDKESDISLGSIAPEEELNKDNNENKANTENKATAESKDNKANEANNNNINSEENMNSDPLNDSNLSLTDL